MLTTEEVYDKYDLDCWCSCGDGWAPLLDSLLSDLVATGFQPAWVRQIKEKFGGLRFYTDLDYEAPEEVVAGWRERIEQAERDSYRICEVCGEPGETRDDLSWILTLCEEHYSKNREVAPTSLSGGCGL